MSLRRSLVAITIWTCSSSVNALPWNIAHRGGAKLAPENSLAAFRQAIEIGADGFELDVHLTRDGDLAVIHDERLERTTNGKGRVRDHTMAELSQLDCGSWFHPKFRDERLPSLAQALAVGGARARYFVEIKHPHEQRYEGIEERLVTQLERSGKMDQTVVISFDQRSLEILHRLKPALATCYLAGDLGGENARLGELKERLGITFVGPYFKALSEALAGDARQHGLKISPWTVNGEDDMKSLIDLGVDSITTDRPDLLHQLLAERVRG